MWKGSGKMEIKDTEESRGVNPGSPEPRLFRVAAHTVSQNSYVNTPGGWWLYQEMQTEVPVVMDRHYLELKLNTTAKISIKWKLSSKCVEQAILKATSITLSTPAEISHWFLQFSPCRCVFSGASV